MRDNRSGKHAEVRACALEQAFGRHVSLGQRERRTGTFDAVDSFNRRASTVTASMSASQSENTRSESHTGNRINGTKGYTIRDGSRDRVPVFGVLCPDRRCCHVESVSGGKVARVGVDAGVWRYARDTALGGSSGCRARPRVRSRSRGTARVGWWWAGVRVRSACAWPARSGMVAVPREPNDWFMVAERGSARPRPRPRRKAGKKDPCGVSGGCVCVRVSYGATRSSAKS